MSDSANTKPNQGTVVKSEALEKILPKKPEEKPAEKEIVKKITITIDNSVEEVLSLDQDGCTLCFDDSPEKFLDLPPAAFKELSAQNRAAYSVSYTFYRKRLEERENPPSGIEVIGPGASATQRLKVEDPRTGVHKAWIRPDQVDEFKARGYKVTNDPRVKSFGGKVGGSHQVSAYGATELILAEIPEDAHEAQQQALADKAVGKSRAIDEGTQAALEAQGGKMDPRFKATAFTPKKKEVIRSRTR